MTVWNVVQAQARRSPEAVAARGAHTYTYRELVGLVGELSGRIAATVPAGSLVALEADSRLSGAVGILAVAAAGGAVLPLHGESPAAHRARVLADARPALLLRETAEAEFALVESSLPSSPRSPSLGETAYLLYTSGSTGQPKGVMVPHDALVERLTGLAKVPGLAAGETVLAMTALSFDISLAELLLPLTVGASFVAVPDETRVDPFAFAELVAETAPDVIQATPSFWRMLTAGEWVGAPGSRLWCGGEPLTPSLARQLLPSGKELWNLYGPTEATIWATAALIDSPDQISLGQPLAGVGTHLAEGSEGELLLYGSGLALGYLDQEQLTAERFPHADTPHGRQRVYRTGDRIRLRPDGSLEFLGRMDSQIKLRGHRIELGEVEAILEEHPAVSQAAVLLHGADQPERAALVAFLVQRSEADVQSWLKERLPPSHCPARIITLPALPRTAAGKVDRVALAANLAPGEEASAPEAMLSREDVRAVVAEAWRQTLAVDAVADDANFFDVGGNSVLLAALQKRLSVDLGVRVPMREIFKNPTTAGLVDSILRTKVPS
ncbi:non-ribosomal peptide synthetase [Streptomyces sp. ADMS]|uniref:non-ribosomal peptide synthetase n=1 Tax=Streptomyces sp. ADMS TaxID=3071415 RepID=UPI00296F1482|nr:non-ribosomal peptide synthetase [Streptomyces sp. ADMS]MDW4909131.1 non-ribosomal peptide synthetase [Streptomyces sp. ADMS]